VNLVMGEGRLGSLLVEGEREQLIDSLMIFCRNRNNLLVCRIKATTASPVLSLFLLSIIKSHKSTDDPGYFFPFKPTEFAFSNILL
jgi:hypothetical protein